MTTIERVCAVVIIFSSVLNTQTCLKHNDNSGTIASLICAALMLLTLVLSLITS